MNDVRPCISCDAQVPELQPKPYEGHANGCDLVKAWRDEEKERILASPGHNTIVESHVDGSGSLYNWICSCGSKGGQTTKELNAKRGAAKHVYDVTVRKDVESPGVGKGHGAHGAHHPVRTGIRDVVLSKIGRLTYRWTPEIHRLVEDDLGTVSERSISRALKRLREDGEIVRTKEGFLLAKRKV